MKRKVVLAFLLTGALVLSRCSKTNNSNETSSGSTSTDSSAQGIDVSNMFSDRDKEIGYDEENSTVIKLSDDSTTCDSDAVQISGNTVTIIGEGTYILSGTLTDGIVIVDAEDTDKVQLVLDGVDITSAESAAIYVREADKVFITTASDSKNILTNGGTYTAIDDNNIDAAIFSKSDLTLNGAGSLTITAKAGHGVVSKDDLVLTSGTYQIDAASHGLSGKDGIHAENADDTSLGFVYLADGTFDITSDGDGISAENWLQADGGVYTVKAGGGSENVQKSDGEWQFGPGQQTESTDTTEEDTVSMKAIKAAGELILKGGKYSLDSADDTIHSNANITISDGEFTLASGDDGIHADSATTISGGTIDITESYEGIEGLSIDITGGETYVSGPTNDGNSALDYNGTGTVTGGIFIAAGSSGMAENFGDSSTQGVMMVTVNSQAAGSAVSLSDSSGNELVSWTPEKEYTSVIISCPEITTGQEYTLTTGSDTTQITMDSIVYGSGSGMGGNPGNGGGPGNGGDMGQKPDDGNGTGKGPGDGGNMGTPPEKS